jgi:hypothetical protein
MPLSNKVQPSTHLPTKIQAEQQDFIQESCEAYMRRTAENSPPHVHPKLNKNTRSTVKELLASLPPQYGSHSVVTPIIADEVALPGDLRTLSLLDHVPPEVAAWYSDPSNILLPTDGTPPPLSNPSIGGSREEYVKLIRRMYAIRMVSFTRDPKVVNGIFGVFKKDGAIRLIINATPANDVMVPSEKVQLPSPTLLSSLSIPEGKNLFVSKTDFENMYHRLRLPAWMTPYFALPAVSAKDLGLEAEFGDVDIFPCCVTLPMGSSHSTFLAQSAHQHFVDKHVPLMRPADRLTRDSDIALDRTRHGQYIDDCFWLSTSEAQSTAAMRQYLDACQEVGWVAKISKTVWPSCRGVEVLGIHIDGTSGLVGLRADRLRQLADVTTAVIAASYCTGRRMRHLIGRWTWALLVRRPALAALSKVYRFCHVADDKCFQIWPSVKRELRTLVGLAPVLVSRTRQNWFPYAVAVDASSLGGGVSGAKLGSECVAALAARPPNLPSADSSVATNTAPIPGVPLVDSSEWKTIASYRFKRPRHINLLELSALTTSVRWVLSFRHSLRSDCLLLSDSAVVVGAVRKGRSSSIEILRSLRRLSALLLSSALQIQLWWIPTKHNPADEPSRRFA